MCIADSPSRLHSSDCACALLRQALNERTDRDGIDLDGLGPDSPLCSMLLLEALRTKGGPLHPVRRAWLCCM
jgi:hypothetical protein